MFGGYFVCLNYFLSILRSIETSKPHSKHAERWKKRIHIINYRYMHTCKYIWLHDRYLFVDICMNQYTSSVKLHHQCIDVFMSTYLVHKQLDITSDHFKKTIRNNATAFRRFLFHKISKICYTSIPFLQKS